MMRRFSSLAVLALLGVSAMGQPAVAQSSSSVACAKIDTTAPWFARQAAWRAAGQSGYTDSAFRDALLALPAFDRALAQGVLLGFEFADTPASTVTPADSAMISRLLTLGAQRGSVWPTRSVVGADGVLAVWSLASRDTALARVALKRMMEAGPDESPPAAVAVLEDRMRVRAGRRQLYGTQLRRVASAKRGRSPVVEALPMEDRAHLDLRRDGAELPPLEQSLCAARSAASQSATRAASHF